MVTVTITGITPQSGGSYLSQGNPPDWTGSEIDVDCLLSLTGNYGAAGGHGDPLSFANPAGLAMAIPGGAPTGWQIDELVVAGAAGLGFTYKYYPGPTLAAPTQNGGVLMIFGDGAVSGQGLTELTPGSSYAGQTPSLTAAVLKAKFKFSRGS